MARAGSGAVRPEEDDCPQQSSSPQDRPSLMVGQRDVSEIGGDQQRSVVSSSSVLSSPPSSLRSGPSLSAENRTDKTSPVLKAGQDSSSIVLNSLSLPSDEDKDSGPDPLLPVVWQAVRAIEDQGGRPSRDRVRACLRAEGHQIATGRLSALVRIAKEGVPIHTV